VLSELKLSKALGCLVGVRSQRGGAVPPSLLFNGQNYVQKLAVQNLVLVGDAVQHFSVSPEQSSLFAPNASNHDGRYLIQAATASAASCDDACSCSHDSAHC
jgi:hypothetical protein